MSGRLVGQITVDDIVHIIQEEAGEDVLLLSGAGDGDINEPIRDSYIRPRPLADRQPGHRAAGRSDHLQLWRGDRKLVALAALMPMVASIGGNAGTQTMAVAVRALATNQLTQSVSSSIFVTMITDSMGFLIFPGACGVQRACGLTLSSPDSVHATPHDQNRLWRDQSCRSQGAADPLCRGGRGAIDHPLPAETR
jgi:hypothetical protein